MEGATALAAALGISVGALFALVTIVAALGIAIYGVISTLNKIFEITEGIKEGIREETRSAIDEIREPFKELGRELGSILTPAIRELIPLGITIANILGKILIPIFYLLGNAITWAVDGIFRVVEMIVEMQNTLMDAIIGMLEWLDDFLGKMADFSEDIDRLRRMKWIWERPEVPELPPGEDPADRDTFTGGRQISEITGPTRDLLITLLSPLASLDSLVGIGNRIYSLLDARLGMEAVGGQSLSVNIERIDINVPTGAEVDEWAARDLAAQVARELRLQLRSSGL